MEDEKKTGLQEISDEGLDHVAGGYGETTVSCPDCGNTIDRTKGRKQSCPYCGHTFNLRPVEEQAR